jgi:hypothetical protein
VVCCSCDVSPKRSFVRFGAGVSNARDAGQGIGIIEAVLLWSPIQMIWPGIGAIIDDAGFEVSFVVNALTGFLPILGLVAWLLGLNCTAR